MKRSLQTLSLGLLVALLASCEVFHSSIVWRGGPYAVVAFNDESTDLGLWYVATPDELLERIGGRVHAIGWDGNYLVAEQHPGGDEAVTNYFIIDAKNDSAAAAPRDFVTGPLSEAEFKQKAEQLTLPPFTFFISVSVSEVEISDEGGRK